MMALFLTIALGYLLGEINIKGFSLGVSAVLFVALFMSWFASKSVPAAMVGTLVLALILYGEIVLLNERLNPSRLRRRSAQSKSLELGCRYAYRVEPRERPQLTKTRTSSTQLYGSPETP
jgi:hypothetical protein